MTDASPMTVGELLHRAWRAERFRIWEMSGSIARDEIELHARYVQYAADLGVDFDVPAPPPDEWELVPDDLEEDWE